MDEKGSISSEIIIVLMIIIMIAGVIVNFTQTSNEKLSESIEANNFEKLTVEISDKLINNPGNPINWNELKRPLNINPGLAIVNEDNKTIPNSVSYFKLIKLGEYYDELINKKIFDDTMKSSISLTPLNSRVPAVNIGSEIFSNNIFTVERHVQCDFFKKYVVKSFQEESICNNNHKDYSCNYFKVFRSNLYTSDYYLLVDDFSKNNLYWALDSTYYHNYFPSPLTSNKIYLNPYIESNLILDNSAVIFIHLNKKDVNGVIVAVPKEFDESKLYYDYFRTNECQFLLKASLN